MTEREQAMREAAEQWRNWHGDYGIIDLEYAAESGADAERARAVAWLRAEAKRASYDLDAEAAYTFAADAIERSEHWKDGE